MTFFTEKTTYFAKFILICILSLSIVQMLQAKENYIAQIKKVSGEVIIKHQKNSFNPVAGNTLQEGDVINTKKSGVVSLVFIDGTELTIGESSEVIINRYLFKPRKRKYAFDMKLRKGSAIYSSGRLAKLSPESVKINTPQATIGVRGTKFLVTVE